MTPMSPLTDRRSVMRGIALLPMVLAAASCRTTDGPRARLAAGEPGGFFWEFSGLLAAAADRSKIASLEPIQTGGSVENLQMLQSGRAELAMSLGDIAQDLAAADDLTAIGRVYENYFQVAVRNDSPVRTPEQLAGRVVNIGAPGSGATTLSGRVLDTVGISGQVRRVEQPMRSAAAQLAAGEVDAAMWAGGLPTPAFADVAAEFRLLDLGPVVATLRQRYGTIYEPVSVPANVYGSHPAVTTVGVANLLLARRGVADPLVAGMVDVLLDDPSSLVPAQAIGSQFLDAQSLIQTGTVALHRGAAAEYRRRHG